MYELKFNKIYECRWKTVSEHFQMYFWERITVEEIQIYSAAYLCVSAS